MPETKSVEIKKALSYGWEAISNNFWYLVGTGLIMTIVSSVGSGDVNDQSTTRSLIGFILSAWITAGFYKITLSLYEEKKLAVTEIFTQFKYFWRILGASLLLAIIVIIGTLFFIIPGIYLALRYQFTLAAIVDKDMSITEAMDYSSKLTDKVKLRLLAFGFAEFGVILLGVLALGLGVLVAMPVVWMANIYVYKKLQ
jgi:uncharacterized membrane protein